MNTKKKYITPLIYSELASWFHLLTAPQDYREEAAFYRRLLADSSSILVKNVLEMGSGGGNNAFHLKSWFNMTLTDISPDILDVSQSINPECEHLQGDMRGLNLGRLFDAVFIHDAIDYILTEADLLKTFKTAFAHLKKGGAALFCPDFTEETFTESVETGGHDEGKRGLRYMDWTWRSSDNPRSWISHFVIILRNGNKVEYRTDEHICGLFPQKTWLKSLAEAGFKNAKTVNYPEVMKECVTPVFIAVK